MKLEITVVAFVVWSGVEGLIIPEELPSLLSLVYSNIPPVKKGTDSRIGLGFRLGPHADFQVLLELGPQTHTNPLGSPTTENPAKREILVLKNSQTLANYVNNFRNYFGEEKNQNKESSSLGGNWIDWWKKNLLSQNEIRKIEFKKIPGIDDIMAKGSQNVFFIEKDPTFNENAVVDHLRQLYKNKQKIS